MSGAVAVVTGGAGFIGSHLVDHLVEAGFKVRVIDDLSGGHVGNLQHHLGSSSVELVEADVCGIAQDDPAFDRADIVFHLAGIGDIVPSIEQPAEYLDTNVQGTVRVLEASRFAGVKKFVYAASSSCYGMDPPRPTPEDAPLDPQYPYALSKLLGEQAALHWHQVYGLPVNVVRIFNAFGPRSRTTGAYGAVFGVFLAQKLAGKPLTVVGDGTQTRDFIFVTDVANAFFQASQTSASGRVFNLGAGSPQSVNRLVELLGGEVTYIPRRPGEPECTWADIKRIKNELDWRPEVSFEAGVEQMLACIDNWNDAPVWNPESIADATRGWFSALSEDRQ
jgi:UDP-glucose 4-epimerase